MSVIPPAPVPSEELARALAPFGSSRLLPRSAYLDEAVLAWEPGRWQIRFIGHGLDTGYQKFVQRKLADVPWVDFSGDVTPSRMPSALRRLDAVLIPTDPAQGETGSYTALEAMATGLPGPSSTPSILGNFIRTGPASHT